jgi:hypothetical protein
MADDSANYYLARKAKLQKSFSRVLKRLRRPLLSRYDEAITDLILADSAREFEAIIPELPYIGGKKNGATPIIIVAGWSVAFLRAMKKHGKTAEEVGTISHETMEEFLRLCPGFLRRLAGRAFAWYAPRRLGRMALESQKRIYPGDWVFRVTPGDGRDFDFRAEYSECGVCKTYRALDAEELLPYCCFADLAMSRAVQLGIVFEKTIGTGSDACVGHFKRGRETLIPEWIPDSLRTSFERTGD